MLAFRAEAAWVTLRLWELCLGVLAAIFAGVFLVGGEPLFGVALLLADSLWLITRAAIRPDTSQPGRYARMRGRLGLTKTVLILGVYAAVAVAAFGLHHVPASDTKVTAEFALAGLAFMLVRELKEASDVALNWLTGSRAEADVGRRLSSLSSPDWLVLHGVPKDRGGDVDHVVCGPGGAFAIETKSYRFRRSDIGQAAGNAAWLKETLGLRWATGVLCVPGSRPASKNGVIWVVGDDELVPWLEKQRGGAVDLGAARDALTLGV
jgi:hypothetical protein